MCSVWLHPRLAWCPAPFVLDVVVCERCARSGCAYCRYLGMLILPWRFASFIAGVYYFFLPMHLRQPIANALAKYVCFYKFDCCAQLPN